MTIQFAPCRLLRVVSDVSKGRIRHEGHTVEKEVTDSYFFVF